jgi:hypothetical protein
MFAFYLVKSDVDVRLIDVRHDRVVTENSPLFTIDDIVSYSRENRILVLKPEAFERFTHIEQTRPDGTPFAICTNRQVLFLGVLWRKISGEIAPYVVARTKYPLKSAAYPLGKEAIEITAGHFGEGRTPENEVIVTKIFDLLEKQWNARRSLSS